MISKGVEERMQEIFLPEDLPKAKQIINYIEGESFHPRHPVGYKDIALSSIQRKFLEYEGIEEEIFWNIINLLKTNGYLQEKRKDHYTLTKSLRKRKIN
jgi:hypothetical protein